MRRLCLQLTVAATTALVIGCEDGPNQTYQPAPPGAGNNWNNGNPDAASTNANQDFDAGYPTSNVTSLCSTDFKRQRWAWMLQQPIQPPRFYAGLDMAKDDLWSGLKIDDAENPPSDPNAPGGGLCQSVPFGFEGTCPSGFGGCNLNAWGNNAEVQFSWNVATHLVDQMILNLGYTGTLSTNKYPDHNGESHSYSLQAGDIVRRDGQPYEIQWSDPGTRKIQITDIFNAAMATFAQKGGVPFDNATCSDDSACSSGSICQCTHAKDANGKPTAACDTPKTSQCGVKNCGNDGNCLVYNDGSVTIFGFRPLVIYIQGTSGVPQPALSTPTLFYNFFSKWEPFSYLPQVVKLDAEGPVASGTPIGTPKGKSITCTQKVGQSFEDFKTNCVQVTGDNATATSVDQVNLNKVIHSLTHDFEHWTANVLGVNQNFTSAKVAGNPDLVVLDNDTPGPGDIAQDWTFDVRARGHVGNDYGPDGMNLRGSALIFIEWARLMLNDIARITGSPKAKTLGDPTCIGYAADGTPNYQHTTGCSGIEGMLIPSSVYTGAAYDFSKDPVAPQMDPAANYDWAGAVFYASVLKPGDVHGGFCIDAGGETDCTADQGISLWANALNHVVRVMGRGDVLNLPAEMRDRRYFFKWFGVAYTKYLKAYGSYPAAKRDSYPDGTVGGGLGPSDVMNQKIDMESLFFDYQVQPGSGGAQTFDKFEYIDREFIGQGTSGDDKYIPFDFEYGTDLQGGNQRYDNWFRRMDREEIAMYSAMMTDKTKTPGAENNVNITNLFGSTLLGGDAASNVAGMWPTYACAIGQYTDPTVKGGNECGGQNPPLDVSAMPACTAAGACGAGTTCVTAKTYETGIAHVCAAACNYTANPTTGCAKANQACVLDGSGFAGCVDMMMDDNGPTGRPLLSHYPAAWSRSPFSRGHSPITLKQADKHPEFGGAKITIPNFKDGPYTASPQLVDATGACPKDWTMAADKVSCNAPLNAGSKYLAPSFSAITPWLEVQPSVGFSIPLDAQHYQYVSTGQLDFTGVLETYLVDYMPWTDPSKASCVSDGKCNAGFTCDTRSSTCVTNDDTIRIAAIEGADFLGEAFVCVDPFTQDLLHVHMYESALTILDWLAAHPGSNGVDPNTGNSPIPSAQQACQILVVRSPYDNYVTQIVSKTYGLDLNVSGGQGQGRITDIVLFDPTLIQAL